MSPEEIKALAVMLAGAVAFLMGFIGVAGSILLARREQPLPSVFTLMCCTSAMIIGAVVVLSGGEF